MREMERVVNNYFSSSNTDYLLKLLLNTYVIILIIIEKLTDIVHKLNVLTYKMNQLTREGICLSVGTNIKEKFRNSFYVHCVIMCKLDL